ncbi:hypothetical protein Pmani_028963 [Petrolisthes manimaculis]|uniref:Uncharacterized protein n=1 Tax=Petrolisthes manimaculis TaxID=1843537 RepID=A0AAE1NYH9_9EUCA|nr:hypothetical protein Pmani_028963 [Petrolisthes manimaculis]
MKREWSSGKKEEGDRKEESAKAEEDGVLEERRAENRGANTDRRGVLEEGKKILIKRKRGVLGRRNESAVEMKEKGVVLGIRK